MSIAEDTAEYWKARAEIAEAELAEHHKGFKETCDAMVRNAKERDHALQAFNDATAGLMNVAAESNRYRLAWQSARRRAEYAKQYALTAEMSVSGWRKRTESVESRIAELPPEWERDLLETMAISDISTALGRSVDRGQKHWDRAVRAEAAIQRVRELHADNGMGQCETCGVTHWEDRKSNTGTYSYVDQPCPTIRALDGGQEADRG